MKLSTVLFLVLYLSSFVSFSQEADFKMFPSIGKEYVYEFSDLNYLQDNEGKKTEMLLKKQTLKLKYEKSSADNQNYLSVEFIGNSVEEPLSDVTSLKDYRYPELVDGFYDRRYPDFYEGLLCRIQFKYNFDFDSSKVTLVNRAGLLEELYSILKEQGFGQQQITERVDIINKKVLKEVTTLVESIYRIPDEMFDPEKFETKLEYPKPTMILSQKKWDKTPGLLSREIIIDKEMNSLKKFRTVSFDTIPRARRYGDKYFEKSIVLKSIRDIAPARFILSGKIENPKTNTVTLAFLDRPFGNELRQEMVFLDENNSFQIDISLKHPEMVFLEIGRFNYIDNSRVLAFYAEPGSESTFSASGEEFPWDIDYGGDFSSENKMLNDFRQTFKIFNERLSFNTLQSYNTKNSYKDFIAALDQVDSFTEKYKSDTDTTIVQFIGRELKAFLYNSIFRNLSQLRYYLRSDLTSMYGSDEDETDLKKMEAIIESVKFNDCYNDYGIYSRFFAGYYLMYYFGIAQKVKELAIRDYKIAGVNLKFYYFSDIEMRTQLARAILAGHGFYSQVVQMCQGDLSRREEMLYQDRSYIYKKVDETLDLILRTCNDTEFLEAVKQLRQNSLQWQNDNYCPEQKFFNQDGGALYFKDFFGEKPTIFYITSDRAIERYYWDKVAEDNPDLNVVLVTEGNNFKEWADYTKRAEPIAAQLLLINNEQTLNDVFLQNSRYYIAYDRNGKLLGTSSQPDTIIGLAKESLQPEKKQLNKSQLQFIVLLLVITLILLVLILIVWKWRVRQRFRKEQQRTRLRELELTAIRSQMNPHFLFNSLNSVQNLVQQNKGREAHLYLSDFAGLIRKVLNNSEKEEVSLAEELEMIQQYLSLEKLRFEFDYSLLVDEQVDVHNTMVPSMILQPFVENAIIHGLQNKANDRQLKIEFEQNGTELKISIEDNGIGRGAARDISKSKNGKGSKLVQERMKILQEKNREKYDLKIIDLKEGTKVEIIIPDEK
ncbi:sensor histidine kinase [Maribellus sediminis]|uniref:sensor histidine kinase n=1 Tax=Maribellus sediminis TaxID=2696285 RepID=UPI0014310782|nr:histidine kinase [Maribellus sediminis]